MARAVAKSGVSDALTVLEALARYHDSKVLLYLIEMVTIEVASIKVGKARKQAI